MSENKANINWFPGHMAKTRREMSEKIKLVDMVIEIRDARIPESSVNPVINEVCGNKRRLIVLAKKDKAEEDLTEKWIESLKPMVFMRSLWICCTIRSQRSSTRPAARSWQIRSPSIRPKVLRTWK